MAEAVRVALGERAYDVVVSEQGYEGLGERIVGLFGRRRVALVWDDRLPARWPEAAVAAARAAGLDVVELPTPVSEATKDLPTWSRVVDQLLTAGVDRRTPVLALGGGVLGDVVGFAAAAALRGVPLVQLPTSLLAMVDSSVGGKTGVNHARGKNLIGAFHQPSLVWAALNALETLPAEELSAGYGEVIKTALLGDAELLERLETQDVLLTEVVARCVRVKAGVVARDEREGGWRAVLNAGHTLGHAYERASAYGIRHGHAVAYGLVDEARWAVAAGWCDDAALPDRLERLAARMGVPAAAQRFERASLLAGLGADKKVDGKSLVVPVPRRAGVMELASFALEDVGALLDCARLSKP